jgi:hypothetical protein
MNVYVCLYACVCVRMLACKYVCMYVCMCKYICATYVSLHVVLCEVFTTFVSYYFGATHTGSRLVTLTFLQRILGP